MGGEADRHHSISWSGKSADRSDGCVSSSGVISSAWLQWIGLRYLLSPTRMVAYRGTSIGVPPCSMERGNSGDDDGSDRSLFIDSRLKYRRAVSHSSFCSANRAPVSRIAAFGVGKMPTTSV